jgi:NAD(P)H-dependent FMN reductase
VSAQQIGGVPQESLVIRIVGVAGSLRTTSATRMAVRWALLGAEEHGAYAQVLDLAAYDLPFLGREQERTPMMAVERFLTDLRGADGILLGSPEIHGSISGVLKNALDLTNRELFEGKMLGIIGVAGGRMGASETLNQLRTIGRSLHAWVVPTQVSIAAADEAFDSRGEPANQEVGERLKSVGRQVAHFARLHKCENHLQFMKDWEGAAGTDDRGQSIRATG